ncbi:MAG: M24 family metallopeptidase [Microcystis sp. LE19-196.1B]|nr:M24 family metallopeptidase [Microcystis sp. LE19-196.1B]
MLEIENIKKIQKIAKNALEHVIKHTKEGMSEEDIKNLAESFMRNNGIKQFWYYDVGAFVLIGKRSLLSISGKDYVPSQVPLKTGEIITIDLSPVLNNSWGDYARTFYIGEINKEKDEDISFINYLHQKFIEIFNPDMVISTLHNEIKNLIQKSGFESLDFRNNFGHSIEEDLKFRKWFDSSNKEKFSSMKFFTFEPHIRKIGSNYGIKHENIYYFDGTKLIEV